MNTCNITGFLRATPLFNDFPGDRCSVIKWCTYKIPMIKFFCDPHSRSRIIQHTLDPRLGWCPITCWSHGLWTTSIDKELYCIVNVRLCCSTCIQVPRFFSEKKNLGTWVGIEPTPSHLRCDALPIELPSSWEQGGGEKGYTSASSWCPLLQK